MYNNRVLFAFQFSRSLRVNNAGATQASASLVEANLRTPLQAIQVVVFACGVFVRLDASQFCRAQGRQLWKVIGFETISFA